MHDPYDFFSSIYRELIISSGHLRDEQNPVIKLFEKFNINSNACIIDAACGTGDLINFLINQGYTNVHGLDSSRGMLARAKEILPANILFCSRWEYLSNYSELENKYDLILILSVSLLHSYEEDLLLIFRNLKKILRKGGILIFDNRNWVRDTTYGLIQPNRVIGDFRFLQEVSKEHKKYLIHDMCSYGNSRQIITYRITELNNISSKLDIEVSYHIKESEAYIPLLLKSGFTTSAYQQITQEWPYETIYAIN